MFIPWKKQNIRNKITHFRNDLSSLNECKESFLHQPYIAKKRKTNKLIEVANLNKFYFNNITKQNILNNISFRINREDVVFILGGNGAGKTTLINCLCGLIKPSSGKIKYFYDYVNNPYEKIGIAFQTNNFIDMFSVWDYLIFVQRLHKTTMSEEYIAMLLLIFGLGDSLNIKASSLSGGQQQRLNLVLAIIGQPRILIFDELSNNLDQSMKIEVLNFMKEYISNFKVTTIVISHDPHEIETLAKRIVILKNGKIIHNTTLKQSFKKYKNAFGILNRLQ